MLKKEELIDLLRNVGFEEQAINRILNKKIKTLLAQGKADEIERIFQVLDDHEIKKENVEKNFGIRFYLINAKELEEVFLEKPDTNILLYMKLKDYYNRIVNQEEINEICNDKKLSNRELFMRLGPENQEDILLQTLYKKGSVYVGKSREMTKKEMEKYSKTLLNISKNVSKNVAYQYREKDISELESLAMSVIIEKCGDVVYNTEVNPEIMSRCIYSKCKKYLIGSILLKKQKELSFDKIKENNPNTKSRIDKKQDTDYNVENSLDLQQWNLNEQQQEILHCLSNFLECGYHYREALNHVADMIGIDQEELMYEMEEIKQIMKEKGEEEII